MECIDAAYAYLTRDCGIDPKQIIAYGRSIGSGPTVDLCARHHVGGMILQSPIASAGLVVMPSFAARALSTFDLFRNYEKISSVTCRSLLMHGRDDQMVPFAHSHDVLYPLLVDPHAPVWLEGCGHHDSPTTRAAGGLGLGGFVDRSWASSAAGRRRRLAPRGVTLLVVRLFFRLIHVTPSSDDRDAQRGGPPASPLRVVQQRTPSSSRTCSAEMARVPRVASQNIGGLGPRHAASSASRGRTRGPPTDLAS